MEKFKFCDAGGLKLNIMRSKRHLMIRLEWWCTVSARVYTMCTYQICPKGVLYLNILWAMSLRASKPPWYPIVRFSFADLTSLHSNPYSTNLQDAMTQGQNTKHIFTFKRSGRGRLWKQFHYDPNDKLAFNSRI